MVYTEIDINTLYMSLITVQRRRSFEIYIQSIIDKAYTQSSVALVKTNTEDGLEFDNILNKFLDLNLVFSCDKKELSSIHSLLDLVKNLESMDITLAYFPRIEFLRGIFSLLNNPGSHYFLLNVKVDPVIVAGIYISKNGNVCDLTLGSILSNYLASNSDALKRIL